MVKAKVFKYVKAFEGAPQPSNFKLIEEELPPLQNGEFLAEALYVSIDPFMRAYGPELKTGTDFIGEQVARIIKSKNPKFPVGRLVVGAFGWRTHSISDRGPVKDSVLVHSPYLLPDIGDLSPSLGLGILGMPGNTAYFGFYKMQEPKAGETLVVSGAAGAVGNIVGQIGKMSGLKVIGIAGSDEKGKWLTRELGFDHFINYKTADIGKELKRLAPEGINIYFDNVGGNISHQVLENIAKRGRVTICGIISQYNQDDLTYGYDARLILAKELKVQGIAIWDHMDEWLVAIRHTLQWIQEGKIKFRETITEGFENLPKALIDMLTGGNTGKAVVKV